jgi:hypothetical protein
MKKLFHLYIQYLFADFIVQALHAPGFSKIKNKKEYKVISNLIANWKYEQARGTGQIVTLIRARDVSYLQSNFGDDPYLMSGRIDLQGPDTQTSRGIRFERYAIQMGKSHFATVHIQVGRRFEPRYIRRAFFYSIQIMDDVWIGEGHPEIPNNVAGRYQDYVESCGPCGIIKDFIRQFF